MAVPRVKQTTVVPAHPGYEFIRMFQGDEGTFWLDDPLPVVAWLVELYDDDSSWSTPVHSGNNDRGNNCLSAAVRAPNGALVYDSHDEGITSISRWVRSYASTYGRLDTTDEVALRYGIDRDLWSSQTVEHP